MDVDEQSTEGGTEGARNGNVAVVDGDQVQVLSEWFGNDLRMLADGCPGSVVAAERLGLAPHTVAQHLAAVRREDGVRSSAAVAGPTGLIC